MFDPRWQDSERSSCWRRWRPFTIGSKPFVVTYQHQSEKDALRWAVKEAIAKAEGSQNPVREAQRRAQAGRKTLKDSLDACPMEGDCGYL